MLSREPALCSALRLRWPGLRCSFNSNHECLWSLELDTHTRMCVAAYESKHNTEAGNVSNGHIFQSFVGHLLISIDFKM